MIQKHVKKIIAVIVLLCLVFSIFFFNRNKDITYSLIHDDEFGGIFFNQTIDDFNLRGFEYGDSVDIVFSNGNELTDIPYYDGYYTRSGEPLLIAYPGYPYIKAGINNGNDLYEIFEIDDNVTATIKIHEKKKYLDIQDARDIVYYDERERYDSDIKFANFREVKVGNIKPGILYRSASPCDNQHNRAPYVDKLIEEAGINFILDLADTESKIEGYIQKDDFNSPYFLSLYNSNKVYPIGINTNYTNPLNTAKIKDGLLTMANSDGPYLIHCTEGKDRTGFILIILEALAGGTYEECLYDYMITYDNYYGIDESSEKYQIIVENVFDDLVDTLTKDVLGSYKNEQLYEHAYNYLLSIGMKSKDIELLKEKISR